MLHERMRGAREIGRQRHEILRETSEQTGRMQEMLKGSAVRRLEQLRVEHRFFHGFAAAGHGRLDVARTAG